MRFDRKSLYLSAAVAAALVFSAGSASAAFNQTNLVSDATDPDLVNAWGISYAPTGPFWVSDNGTGKTTLYNGAGVKQGLIVGIFPGAGSSAPTGQVFNGTASDFQITSGGKTGKSAFIFATEDGTISGWAPSVDAGLSHLGYDGSADGAVYKGLAIGNNGVNNVLYAADFANERVDVITGTTTTWLRSASFTDSALTAKGYSPFDTQVLNGKLYVTFAKTTGTEDEADGPGLGFVDEFNLDGTFSRRIASNGVLDAPWGLAIAPADFGAKFGGDLLVGNFGNGQVNAFDLTTLQYDGKLRMANGTPITIDGLWGLIPGNDAAAGSSGNIYFSAGPNGESGGLFGFISPTVAGAVPEPATWATMLIGFGLIGAAMRRRVTRVRAS